MHKLLGDSRLLKRFHVRTHCRKRCGRHSLERFTRLFVSRDLLECIGELRLGSRQLIADRIDAHL